jgi:hypothetical protein
MGYPNSLVFVGAVKVRRTPFRPIEGKWIAAPPVVILIKKKYIT